MNKRIIQIRKELKVSSKDFAKRIGFTPSYITHIEKGDVEINERVQKLICSEFNVNLEWLKTGKGEMFLPYKEDPIGAFCEEHGIGGGAKVIITAYSKLSKTAKQEFETLLDCMLEEYREEKEQELSVTEEEYVEEGLRRAEEDLRREYQRAKEALKGEVARDLLEKAL